MCWRWLPRAVELDRFAQAWNLGPDQAEAVCGGDGISIFDGRGYDTARWRQGQVAVLEEVARFHAAHPDSFGPSAAQLLRADLVKGGPGFRRAALESLIQAKTLVREGAQIRRSSHSIELSLSEKALWRKIAPLLGPDRRPMTVHDIAAQQQLELKVVQRILQRATRAGQVVRIASGRFLHKSAFLDLAAKAETLAANSDGGLFAVTAFRDQSNLGRGVSIELLEYFDRIGFTQRVGDQRRVLKAAAHILDVDRS